MPLEEPLPKEPSPEASMHQTFVKNNLCSEGSKTKGRKSPVSILQRPKPTQNVTYSNNVTTSKSPTLTSVNFKETAKTTFGASDVNTQESSMRSSDESREIRSKDGIKIGGHKPEAGDADIKKIEEILVQFNLGLTFFAPPLNNVNNSGGNTGNKDGPRFVPVIL